LRQAGIPPERIVHPPADSLTQDSESLLALLGSLPVPLKRALIVRGTQGRDWLGNALSARQVKVDFLPVYERVPAIWPVATTRALTQCLLHQPDRCLFLLTSSEGVRALAGKFESLGMMDAWSRGVFIVIHERIGATLQSVLSPHWSGGGAGRVALCAPDDDAIVDAIQAQLLSAEP
jgi:uroporphyrinogen-III synthase